jgi:hypothetical protein
LISLPSFASKQACRSFDAASQAWQEAYWSLDTHLSQARQACRSFDKHLEHGKSTRKQAATSLIYLKETKKDLELTTVPSSLPSSFSPPSPSPPPTITTTIGGTTITESGRGGEKGTTTTAEATTTTESAREEEKGQRSNSARVCKSAASIDFLLQPERF